MRPAALQIHDTDALVENAAWKVETGGQGGWTGNCLEDLAELITIGSKMKQGGLRGFSPVG